LGKEGVNLQCTGLTAAGVTARPVLFGGTGLETRAMGKLDGRTAIVTGGARGLGRHFAQALAGEGATVAILDITSVDAAVAAINAAAQRKACFGFTCDVSDEASVEAAVAAVIERTGRIDILVNNAAVFSTLPTVRFSDIDVALWDRVMAVNLRGPFLLVKHAAQAMTAGKGGKIINISSGTAYKGMPLMLHYVTSKGGLVAFTRALSRELGAHNICVNTLAPGLTLSDSIEANEEHLTFARDRVVQSRAIQRDGYPGDLLGALIFLASADSDFVTGQTIAVDGGSINT
jgi:NAD(P)-dependent dehydrogenase (short-subunit alcohol dehydrogenase family)